MSQNAEVLIIGAGAVGLCAADHLQAAGKSVTIVDRREIASGSSYGNAGLIVPSYSIPLAHPGVITQGLRWLRDPESPFYIKPRLDLQLGRWLWHFYRASTHRHVQRALPVIRDLHLNSRKMFAAMADDMPAVFGYAEKGLLELFATPQAYDEGCEDAALLRDNGIAVEFPDSRQTDALLGGLPTRKTCGAIYFPYDAQLDPARLCRALAEKLIQNGVKIKTQTEVIALKRRATKVVTVETTRGDYRPESVVIAAGAWSAALARDLKLRLPMQAAKGYSITYQRPQLCPALPLSLAEARMVITPFEDRLRLAGTLELAGHDLSFNRRRIRAIMRNAHNYLPDLDPRKMQLEEIWSGLRPCSPDGLPYLGRPQGIANVVVATGHGMLGVSQAPASGRIVADLICGRRPPLDINLLRVNRFS